AMSKMRVAVVGAGISGLVSAYVLAKAGVDVVLYEKEDYLGGHARTVTFDGVDLDLGFMVFNRQKAFIYPSSHGPDHMADDDRTGASGTVVAPTSLVLVTYPNMMEFFESLGVDMEVSDMSLSVSLEKGQGCEWGSRNGISSLFAQKKNALSPYFWQMLREIIKFKDDVMRYLEDLENDPAIDRNETLGQFIESHGYSELFQKAYLLPMCSSIWSCPSEGVMVFSAYSVLSFCRNHHLLQVQLLGRPQWLTVRWRSHDYVNKVREELECRSCEIRSGCAIQSVSTVEEGCIIISEDGSEERYDGCIIATHAPDTLKILGELATHDERRVLGAFNYVYSDIYLHRDTNLIPQNPAAWSAWNFLGNVDNKVCLTYWLNVLQNIDEKGLPYLVTLNPSHTPEHILLKWSTGHPIPSVAASKASLEIDDIQGKRGIWFCGAYQGYGFHEDGLKAGMVAAHGILRKSCAILKNPKHMVPSLVETGARLFVTRFLGNYIASGCLIASFASVLMKYKLNDRNHLLSTILQVVTQADLGLADAYINGDFSFVDKKEGLLNLFMMLIANRDVKTSNSRFSNKRGWWTPLLLTAGIASAKYFFQHVSRQNTLTQARRNISRHYDLSNELFALFLDETMTYSCAIFKTEDEDLKIAQMRKISGLIEKARIKKGHKILEIGCGWGSLAIEVVRRTGCNYTGITLSEEQLRYAEMEVKKAGLQDHIRFLLCDYRQLPETYKYDRIISCEMLEAVGHEYMEEFFTCCESVLAKDGLFVLQFISIPDERYDEYRRSSDFIKEYIFPGGCLPSLSRVTSAMAAASRLCVEHVENIGIHYYRTLRCWRQNFLEKQSKILALGFNQKFIRTWEYYFDYCAAGFKTHTLGNYQVRFY
ncbi:hypothetical protein RJ640_010492, partial [Escallonia rubra]